MTIHPPARGSYQPFAGARHVIIINQFSSCFLFFWVFVFQASFPPLLRITGGGDFISRALCSNWKGFSLPPLGLATLAHAVPHTCTRRLTFIDGQIARFILYSDDQSKRVGELYARE